MISRQEFTKFLWESLQEKKYVWLNPGIQLEREDAVPEILLAPKSVKQLLPHMRKHPGMGSCRASFRFENTFAVFSFGERSYPVNFVHKMVSRSLYFMKEEEIWGKKVRNRHGIFIPSIEHSFEYALLKAFLNRKGVKEEEYLFFREFHILVQEDLLEFFNEKYATNFKRLYSITEYNGEVKNAMINCLKELAINRLTRVMNIHWHNFLGSVRKEARMI